MKIRALLFIAVVLLLNSIAFAQSDSFIGQITDTPVDKEVLVKDISGDGRLVVIESTANLATENPNNADGNKEIFIFDYAQRRIFQITNTKSLLTNVANPITQNNIKVEIANSRPVISNDGKWIAFSSNATTSTPTTVNSTNPGNFDANSFTDTNGNNVLVNNGNMEVWFYRVPDLATTVDLRLGNEVPFQNLSGGAFTQVTNTLPTRLPVPGTENTPAIYADDHRDISINDNGNVLAFISDCDLVTGGNTSPDDNEEVFTYVRSANQINQVSQTPFGTISDPTFNYGTSISGDGRKVVFVSNAQNPIIGMTGGNNSGTERNEELFLSELSPTGAPTGVRKQITVTRETDQTLFTNVLIPGKRMSRDGKYILFESTADLTNTNAGNNHTSLTTFLYDTTATTNPFRQIGARGRDDSGAPEGDVFRFASFSNYDSNGTPASIVLATRLNIKADGTVPSNPADGLNNVNGRPAQIYVYSIASQTFDRITQLPIAATLIVAVNPIPSNSARRLAFNLSQTEFGTRNFDGNAEGYYLVTPNVNSRSAATLNYATGASNIPISPDPVPTPSPTATPTPTPTPSPTPTPTPTPTPQTPPAVQGVSPGMLAITNVVANIPTLVVPKTAVGSNSRRLPLPMELSGVSMTINGAACGLKSVGNRQIMFIVPPGLTAGNTYPLVLNLNGVALKGTVRVVPTRPDIFTWDLAFPGAGGRAKTLNITNRVHLKEPFNTKTLKLKNNVLTVASTPTDEQLKLHGTKLFPTVIRLYLTGVLDVQRAFMTIRIRDKQAVSSVLVNNLYAQILNNPQPTDIPGEYYVDFLMPSGLNGAGDVPIVLTISGGGVTYETRLDDTAARIRIN